MEVEDYSKYDDIPMMPFWASGLARGEFKLFSQLPTKDGRIVGNAVITEVNHCRFYDETLYTVVTDAGTVLKYLKSELKERFHPPKFLMKRGIVKEDYKVILEPDTLLSSQYKGMKSMLACNKSTQWISLSKGAV